MKTYFINELPEEVKSAAIQAIRNTYIDTFEIIPGENWDEALIEQWVEKLEDLGYVNPVIKYSGFGSQGDGASFEFDRLDTSKDILKEWLMSSVNEEKKEEIWGDFFNDVEITNYRPNSRYFHERSVTVNAAFFWETGEITFDSVEQQEEIERQIQINLDTMQIEVSKKIYGALETLYDSLTSDEALTQYALENDVEFTIEGVIYGDTLLDPVFAPDEDLIDNNETYEDEPEIIGEHFEMCIDGGDVIEVEISDIDKIEDTDESEVFYVIDNAIESFIIEDDLLEHLIENKEVDFYDTTNCINIELKAL